MMKRMVTALALLLFVAAAPGLAYETLTTVFVDGIAPMVMDGNLDDWANIPAQEVPVTHPVEKTRDDAKVIATHGATDCAFSFKCFADQKFVYFALTVKDDIVLVGRHMYGKGWLDDSNTLYFDGDCVDVEKEYYDINDGQLKVIGNPPSGVKYIEGYVPYFFEGNFPCFWEARGVKSGFRITEDGYITEIALPASLLGWDVITAEKVMGANLRVVDKDGDPDDESTDKGYIWAPDPDHTAHFSARSYNRIAFSIVVPAHESSPQSIQLVQNDNGIVVQLGMPDITKGQAILNSVLYDLEKADFDPAEAKLLPIQNELWVKPLLGSIQLRKGDIVTGTNMLIDFGEECPYPWGEEYIRALFKDSFVETMLSYKGKTSFIEEGFNDTILSILKIYLERYPDAIITEYRNLQCIKHASNSNDAVEMLRAMESRCNNNQDKMVIQKTLMYILNYTRNYTDLQIICNQVLTQDIEPEEREMIYYYLYKINNVK
jgi:hypothetical protein